MRAGHLVINVWFVVCVYLDCGFLDLHVFGHDGELLLSCLHTTADYNYNREQTDTQTSVGQL